MSRSELRPFRVEISDEELVDLHQRLDRTRWAPEIPGAGWDYGVPGEYLEELVAYWRNGYDWRAWEAMLNEYPQFTTVIDGQRVHFLHVRSADERALPLIMTHGWPGSFVEFLDLIEPMSSPADDRAFHVVIPSLPGYAFSGPTTERGWDIRRIAAAWAELMSRLGYERYGAVGNDWGSEVSLDLGRVDPQRVVGVHVTQIPTLPLGTPGELDDLTPEEEAAVNDATWFKETLGAYQELQSQQPQTLAHALTDSPVGLLAWHSLILGTQDLDADFVLTNVMLYWLTGTTASATRLYYEAKKAGLAPTPTTVPVGLAQFTHDYQPIRRFVDRDHKNVVSWNRYDRPGHYAAHQSPDLLIADIRAFFAGLG